LDKQTQKIVFSNNTDLWATPQDFYDNLNQKYSFNLDPCADATNTKCSKYFTEQDDGLSQDWGGHNVFVNPPYSKVKQWVNKAYEESKKPNTVVVMLVAARTDTKFFHDYCTKANQILFIKGRLKFGGSVNSAPFPSMVVVFGGDRLYVPPKYGRMDSKANEL
jgi:site-specific DNA-methyltransferase (adenine-specific)